MLCECLPTPQSEPNVRCTAHGPSFVSLQYLSLLAQSAKTGAPLLEAVSALSWVNQIAAVEDTTDYPLVVQVLAGAKRKVACTTSKMEPITPEILSTLVSRFGQQDASLSEVRTLTICLIGFAGFFHFDQLSKIKESDILLYRDHVVQEDRPTQGWCMGGQFSYSLTALPGCNAGEISVSYTHLTLPTIYSV